MSGVLEVEGLVTEFATRNGALRASEAMRGLFADVFGHAMSVEHWQWKYGQGRGIGMGLMRDGRMLAHYGGVSRRVAFFNQPMLACQVCDVMVERSANRALVRKGPLYRVAAGFLEAEVGSGRRHPVAFGFPNDRAHAVAERLGLYERIDELVQVSWPAAPLAASPGARRLTWQPIGQAGVGFGRAQRRCIDALWARMAPGFTASILGVRDAQWLSHRFLMHPKLRYELLLVRGGWLRRPIGVLVLRRHADHLHLLDLVAPVESFAALIGVARRLAADGGLPRLHAWVTRSHVQRLLGGVAAGTAQATVTALNVPLPSNIHTPGPGVEAQRERWFLMAGDADFT